MTTETTTTDPATIVDPAAAAAAAAVAETTTTPAVETAPPVAETPAAPDPAADKPHGNKGAKPWFLQRISEETEARRQAEDRARNAEELLQATQRRSAADPAATTTTAPAADESAIEARARQIAEERLSAERIQSVIRSGVAKFPDWDERAGTLAAAGAASPAFVLDVVSVDPQNAHLILHQLADDPQKAAHLARMDTRTRTIELVKMSMAAQGTTEPTKPVGEVKPAVPPKTVSKAPPPAPSIDHGAAQPVDWRSDKVSDADFSRGWEENQRKRAERRR